MTIVKRCSFFLGIMLFSLFAHAQKITPLYSSLDLKTYLAMPFRLQDPSNNSLAISSIEVTAGKTDCFGMIDPLVSSNFFLKCTAEAAVTVNVFFNYNGKRSRIVYGPLNIVKISNNGIPLASSSGGGSTSGPTPPPATLTPETPPPTDLYMVGRVLYQNNCLGCHANPAAKANRTAAQITAAIVNVGVMRSIVLTQAQITEISRYMSNLP